MHTATEKKQGTQAIANTRHAHHMGNQEMHIENRHKRANKKPDKKREQTKDKEETIQSAKW